jgi:hypothetical protein
VLRGGGRGVEYGGGEDARRGAPLRAGHLHVRRRAAAPVGRGARVQAAYGQGGRELDFGISRPSWPRAGTGGPTRRKGRGTIPCAAGWWTSSRPGLPGQARVLR